MRSNRGQNSQRRLRTRYAYSAVLDREICCLERDGSSNFHKLLFRRDWPYFYAFDVVSIEGKDLRRLPLLERKRQLARIMPRIDSRLLMLEHIAQRGCDLYRAASERDLEGIVGKWCDGTYQTNGSTTSWLKMKNPAYTQMENRHKLFERRIAEGRPAKRGTSALELVLC